MNAEAPKSEAPKPESLTFESRHIGPSPAEQERMLAATGHTSLDELTGAALPPGSVTRGRWACRPRCPRRKRSPSCAAWPPGTRWPVP